MSNYPFFVEVSIPEQIYPDERDRRYGDPLSSLLESKGLGLVIGVGTSVADRVKTGETDIVESVLDVDLANLGEALTFTKRTLVELGVPVGTEVRYWDAAEVKHVELIGELELLLVFIDNQSLPLHIYENVDTETLLEGLQAAFSRGNVGEVRGPRAWESKVLIYFAGKNVDEMFTRIQSLPKTFPILQNARIEFQTKRKKDVPGNLRLPFNE